MSTHDLTDEDLERIGAALARGALRVLDQRQADQRQADHVVEEGPLAEAAEDVFAALVPWAKQAARTPRQKGSPEDQLLEAVKRYLVLQRQADEDDPE